LERHYGERRADTSEPDQKGYVHQTVACATDGTWVDRGIYAWLGLNEVRYQLLNWPGHEGRHVMDVQAQWEKKGKCRYCPPYAAALRLNTGGQSTLEQPDQPA
jgi:hypothetical protein